MLQCLPPLLFLSVLLLLLSELTLAACKILGQLPSLRAL
jgi:hypothetical protein